MDDLISRQAAIDALDGEIEITGRTNAEAVKGYVRLVKDRLERLPSAQPEPCEDAVSRKAVKDGFVEMCNLICPYTEKQRHTMCGSCLLGTAFDVLEATPPVTPKQRTGKCKWCERLKERNLRIEYYWIDQEGCTASFSEPHIVATGIAKFCPNCGAKITEGDAE